MQTRVPLLHRRVPHRAKGRRVDVELPVKSLCQQNHRALRNTCYRQERADADCRGDCCPIAHIKPIVNACWPLCWIEYLSVRRHDALLTRFSHGAATEWMGNDPIAAERGHAERIGVEDTAHAFDHRLDLLLCPHAL